MSPPLGSGPTRMSPPLRAMPPALGMFRSPSPTAGLIRVTPRHLPPSYRFLFQVVMEISRTVNSNSVKKIQMHGISITDPFPRSLTDSLLNASSILALPSLLTTKELFRNNRQNNRKKFRQNYTNFRQFTTISPFKRYHFLLKTLFLSKVKSMDMVGVLSELSTQGFHSRTKLKCE